MEEINSVFAFEKLDVWKLSKEFCGCIYKLTKKIPDDEKFILINQIKRAVISIPLNIAEGSSRSSFKEQARFSEIAYGSLLEVYCALKVAVELNYIDENMIFSIQPMFKELANKINSLKNSQLRRANQSND